MMVDFFYVGTVLKVIVDNIAMLIGTEINIQILQPMYKITVVSKL